MTIGSHKNSRINYVNKNSILKYLSQGGIPIITGFQGIDKNQLAYYYGWKVFGDENENSLSKNKTTNISSISISLFSSVATFFLSLFLWYSLNINTSEFQFVEEKSWINNYIKFKLGVDGISILFIVLTTFITPICIISCVNSVKVRVKEFLIAILILETFMIGVFCSLDLVIFYLFFEAGLIPMFLIIGVWGGPRRVYSAFKFFLFTLLGSVLMLVAIIAIYWITGTTDVI